MASTRATRRSRPATGKAAGTIVATRRRAGIDRARSGRRKVGMAAPGGSHAGAPAHEQRPEAGDAAVADAVITDGIDGDGPTAPSGTCSCGSRHADRSGWGASLVEPGEDVARCRASARARTGCRHAADPGATGHGQDLGRRAHDPGARRGGQAGRRDCAVPQDDQQHARGRRRCGDARTGRAVRIHPEGATPTRCRPHRGRDPGRRQRRRRGGPGGRDGRRRRRDRLALRSAEFDGAFDVLFVDEAEPDVTRQRRRDRDVRAVDRPDRRPEPAADGDARASSPAARSPRRSSTSSATRRRCRPSAVSSSRRRAGCIRPSTRYISPAFYGVGSDAPEDGAAVVDGDDQSCPVPGFGGCRRAHGQRASLARGGGGRRRRVAALIGMTWQDVDGRRRPITRRRRHRRRAVQRAGGGDPGGARPRIGRGGKSAPSTSSRAGRASSRSTRWRARAGRTHRGTWASSTRGTG